MDPISQAQSPSHAPTGRFVAYILAAAKPDHDSCDSIQCALITVSVPFEDASGLGHKIFIETDRWCDPFAVGKIKHKLPFMRPSHVRFTTDSTDVVVTNIEVFNASDASRIALEQSPIRSDVAYSLHRHSPIVYKLNHTVTLTKDQHQILGEQETVLRWRFRRGSSWSRFNTDTWKLPPPRYRIPFFLSRDAALFVPRSYDVWTRLNAMTYPYLSVLSDGGKRAEGVRVGYTEYGFVDTSEFIRGAYRVLDYPIGTAYATQENERDDSELDARDATIDDETYQKPYRVIAELLFGCAVVTRRQRVKECV